MHQLVMKTIEWAADRIESVREIELQKRSPHELLQEFRRLLRQRSIKDRIGGWGTTLGLLSIMFLLAAWSNVSSSDYATRIITFTSMAMPASAPSAAPSSSAEAPAPAAELTLPTRTEITLVPSSNLARASLGETRRNLSGTENNVSRRSITTPSPLTTPQSRTPITTPGVRRRSPIGQLATRMTLPGSRPTLESSSTPPPLLAHNQETPEAREIVDAPKVRVFDENTLTAEDERTIKIIDWVRQNPAEVPIVVRTHMDYLDGDHVARATAWINGQEVDLYMLVRSGYSQLHVLMVTGGNSYLFVDRGMRNEASRFRVGKVSRQEGNVVRIISEEREITSGEAQEFYTAFIEWWETTSGQ